MLLLLNLAGLAGCVSGEPDGGSSPKRSPGVIGDIADTGGDSGMPRDSAAPGGDSAAPRDSAAPGGDSADERSPPQLGEVIFTELMINPAATYDADGEWIELLNVSETWLDLSGCQIRDADLDLCELSPVGGGDLSLAPGARLVLCANPESTANGGVDCGASYVYHTSGQGCALANAGDEVILTDAAGTLIDRVHYEDGEGLDAIPDGASLGLDEERASGVENDDPQSWCPQSSPLPGGDYGTPGRINDTCP